MKRRKMSAEAVAARKSLEVAIKELPQSAIKMVSGGGGEGPPIVIA